MFMAPSYLGEVFREHYRPPYEVIDDPSVSRTHGNGKSKKFGRLQLSEASVCGLGIDSNKANTLGVQRVAGWLAERVL